MRHRRLVWTYLAVAWLMLPGASRVTAWGEFQARGQEAGSPAGSARQNAPAPTTPPGTMKFRVTRRAGLEPGPDQPTGEPAAPGTNQVFALDPAGADWTLSLSAKAEVEIFYQGVLVIKSTNAFLTGQGRPTSPNITVRSRGRNQAVISGTVDGFGLNVKARAVPLSPH